MIKSILRPVPSSDFIEDPAVLQKQDTIGKAGTEGVMGYHENGSVPFPVLFGHNGEKHPGSMGIQRTCRFIRHNQLRIADHCTGKGAVLLLASGNLEWKFF